jgi:hypothetical protein
MPNGSKSNYFLIFLNIITRILKDIPIYYLLSVIEEENIKPLEVTKDFVLNFDKKEKQIAEDNSKKNDKKVSTLGALRQTLEKKVDLKTRTAE